MFNFSHNYDNEKNAVCEQLYYMSNCVLFQGKCFVTLCTDDFFAGIGLNEAFPIL